MAPGFKALDPKIVIFKRKVPIAKPLLKIQKHDIIE